MLGEPFMKFEWGSTFLHGQQLAEVSFRDLTYISISEPSSFW